MSKSTRKSTTPAVAAPVEVDVQALVAAAVAQALAAAGVGATATAVAEKAAPAKPDVDPLVEFVGSKGYALARGGRAYFTKDTLAAMARVLNTGTSEIVAVTKESLVRRGVTGVVVFRSADGEVATSHVYKP